jgi:hypothetical protein
MEDYQTSTVDGAEGFARYHAEPEHQDFDPNDDCDEFDPEERNEERECNCSDPGCPCRGFKRGCV